MIGKHTAPRLAPIADQLVSLAREMLAAERTHRSALRAVHPKQFEGARNLLHYLVMRRRDLRSLQRALAQIGLSSLGRCESHALWTVCTTLSAVRNMMPDGHPAAEAVLKEVELATDLDSGGANIRAHTRALFGAACAPRGVHIMVTMGTEAAHDDALVPGLLEAGMTCMRINCAHDTAQEWKAMIRHLRRRAQDEPSCRVLMDLAGPKLRTGSIAPGPNVVKVKPTRDALGRVIEPARVLLRPQRETKAAGTPDVSATVEVNAKWLRSLDAGDRVRLTDARGRHRVMKIQRQDGQIVAELRRTAYLTDDTILSVATKSKRSHATSSVAGIEAKAGVIRLKPGSRLVLTRDAIPGEPATRATAGGKAKDAHVSCSLSQVFSQVRSGERILLDDGKLSGVAEHVDSSHIRVRVTHTPDGGGALRSDKGINFPDSRLKLPALTRKDRQDLRFIVKHADIVGLSFTNRASDVRSLLRALAPLPAARRPGIILKIETREGFEQLPQILLAAMRHPNVGVMVARGDLAAELGYERLSEVQEEMLWLCEAAHLPAVWATQVLESLAKHGQPSRAEITDAAMGNRAECVMLNKGPHIREAVRVLADILDRMAAHQDKKTSMLRALKVAGKA